MSSVDENINRAIVMETLSRKKSCRKTNDSRTTGSRVGTALMLCVCIYSTSELVVQNLLLPLPEWTCSGSVADCTKCNEEKAVEVKVYSQASTAALVPSLETFIRYAQWGEMKKDKGDHKTMLTIVCNDFFTYWMTLFFSALQCSPLWWRRGVIKECSLLCLICHVTHADAATCWKWPWTEMKKLLARQNKCKQKTLTKNNWKFLKIT